MPVDKPQRDETLMTALTRAWQKLLDQGVCTTARGIAADFEELHQPGPATRAAGA